jgi:hypothetical protein
MARLGFCYSGYTVSLVSGVRAVSTWQVQRSTKCRRLQGCPSLIPEQIARLQMRTFQQDTVLHVVTERSSSLQIAGGPRAQGVMRTLLSDSQAIYRSTEVEVSDHGAESIIKSLTWDTRLS